MEYTKPQTRPVLFSHQGNTWNVEFTGGLIITIAAVKKGTQSDNCQKQCAGVLTSIPYPGIAVQYHPDSENRDLKTMLCFTSILHFPSKCTRNILNANLISWNLYIRLLVTVRLMHDRKKEVRWNIAMHFCTVSTMSHNCTFEL